MVESRIESKIGSLSPKLDHFCKLTDGETALPLIIADSEDQLKFIIEYLQTHNYALVTDFGTWLENLTKTGMYSCVLAAPHKSLYDMIVQYPMGQIQLIRPHDLAPILIAPHYEASRILVITNHHLNQWQQDGYDLLAAVGMTLRLESSD
jgi:hypothetical protein